MTMIYYCMIDYDSVSFNDTIGFWGIMVSYFQHKPTASQAIQQLLDLTFTSSSFQSAGILVDVRSMRGSENIAPHHPKSHEVHHMFFL